MSTDLPPPGNHPTDAVSLRPGDHPTDVMLLFLGDITDESMMRDLANDLDIDAGPDAGPDDEFSLALVTKAWTHLQQCSECGARRGLLMGRVSEALVAVSTADSWVASGVDGRVRNAAAALVASSGQEPSISAVVGPRRAVRGRRFRSGVSLDAGRATGVLARRWPLAAAAAVLVVGGGLVIGFRPGATQKGAIRSRTTTTVASPNRNAVDATADTALADTDVTDVTGAAESKAAPGRAAAKAVDGANGANGAVQDQESFTTQLGYAATEPARPAAAPPAPSGAKPSTLPASAPGPQAANSQAAAPPAPVTTSTPKPAQTTAGPNNTTPPDTRRSAKKSAAAPSPASDDAIAAGSPSVPVVVAPATPLAGMDLGAFLTVNDALDRFATFAAAPSADRATNGASPAAVTPVTPVTPATAAPAAPAAPAAGELSSASSCPAVVGDRRATATIGGRPVVLVRTTEATTTAAGNDLVIDATTCVVIGQRSSASTAFAPPNTAPTTSLPR